MYSGQTLGSATGNHAASVSVEAVCTAARTGLNKRLAAVAADEMPDIYMPMAW